MPSRNSQLRKTCPVELALDVIGGKWKGIIIHRLLNEEMRFNALKRSIPAISQRMLTTQLKQLVEEGVIERQLEDDGGVKVTYRLTKVGKAIKPLMVKLRAWGNLLLAES